MPLDPNPQGLILGRVRSGQVCACAMRSARLTSQSPKTSLLSFFGAGLARGAFLRCPFGLVDTTALPEGAGHFSAKDKPIRAKVYQIRTNFDQIWSKLANTCWRLLTKLGLILPEVGGRHMMISLKLQGSILRVHHFGVFSERLSMDKRGKEYLVEQVLTTSSLPPRSSLRVMFD